MRRGEILALRWTDFDPAAKTLRIERALEYTVGHELEFKAPKSERGRRTIAIDDFLIELLRKEREKYLRIVAGVPAGAAVDLLLVRLADEALVFPSPEGDLSLPRHPDPITKQFRLRAIKLGFPGLRFHDLRGSHGTWLLDKGAPVHTVAKRLGHDPGVLLRVYAKRTKKSDESAAAVIGEMTRNMS
jgi:integrase